MLVGGFGTRLRPLTLELKKELMPVGGRPFLEHVLANLARHGVDEAILTTGYLAEAFEDFPRERAHGVKLTIVREEQVLDTGGAVKNVEELLDDTFLVLNGDILTDLDISALVAFHREKGGAGTITLTWVDDPSAYGLVPTDAEGRIERFIEKPRADDIVTNLVNAGTYVLEPEVLKYAPEGEKYSIERGLFPTLLAEDAALFGFHSPAYWLDIGTPAKYLRANRDVLDGRVGEPPEGERTPDGAWLGPDAVVHPKARVWGPVVIGPGSEVAEGAVVHPLNAVGAGCRIGSHAAVEASVLLEDVTIEPGAVVERSVLSRGVTIGPNSRVVEAVLGPGVRVGADNELRGGIRIWPGLDIPDATIRF